MLGRYLEKQAAPSSDWIPSPSHPRTSDLTRLRHDCSVSFNKYCSAQSQCVGHFVVLSLCSFCIHNNYGIEIQGQLRTHFSVSSGTDGTWLSTPWSLTPWCGVQFPSAGLRDGPNIYFHSTHRNPTSLQTQPLRQICFKSAVGSKVTGEGSTDMCGCKLPISLG